LLYGSSGVFYFALAQDLPFLIDNANLMKVASQVNSDE